LYRKYGLDRKELNKDKTDDKINEYDVAIIGGGIVGAGLLRDQSLNGVTSILIEQADFSSQTSAGSSKMLHGGIRYLENMDFALVFEALFEKNLWLKLAPHVTQEIPFYLPVYKESKWPLFFVNIGLFIYDLLSLFKNSPHKSFNKKNTLKKLKGLNATGLRGCGMYFDGIVDDSKLGLDCIKDALFDSNSEAINYTKVIKIESIENKYKLTLKDTLNSTVRMIIATHIQFATGPFTDLALKELGIPWEPVLSLSKGTHLWLKKEALEIDQAMVLQTSDGRIIFVIPQRESILIGTTELPLDKKEEILNIKATDDEIIYLLDQINHYFPKVGITKKSILSTICAVRPLVKDGGSTNAKISRKHKIFNPQKNIHVLVGGKYTTFRRMAQDLNKLLFKELDRPYNKNLTKNIFRASSIVKNPFSKPITCEDIDKIIETEFVRTKEDLIKRRLSLPSLEHYKNSEIIDKLNKLDIG
jgi:glycerol-3-phosphate dehydrogenase